MRIARCAYTAAVPTDGADGGGAHEDPNGPRALIDSEGFINLTDELGGATVHNKYPSVSQAYNFPVGNINLRDEEALAYLRERTELPHGDLDRAERHRVVLHAILAKGLGKETISNPLKFVSFVRGVSR